MYTLIFHNEGIETVSRGSKRKEKKGGASLGATQAIAYSLYTFGRGEQGKRKYKKKEKLALAMEGQCTKTMHRKKQ